MCSAVFIRTSFLCVVTAIVVCCIVVLLLLLLCSWLFLFLLLVVVVVVVVVFFVCCCCCLRLLLFCLFLVVLGMTDKGTIHDINCVAYFFVFAAFLCCLFYYYIFVSTVSKHQSLVTWPLERKEPVIAADTWIAPSATVAGIVEVWHLASIWYGATIRAETTYVRIGKFFFFILLLSIP